MSFQHYAQVLFTILLSINRHVTTAPACRQYSNIAHGIRFNNVNSSQSIWTKSWSPPTQSAAVHISSKVKGHITAEHIVKLPEENHAQLPPCSSAGTFNLTGAWVWDEAERVHKYAAQQCRLLRPPVQNARSCFDKKTVLFLGGEQDIKVHLG